MELSLKHVHPLAVLAASSTCSVRGLRAKGGPGGKGIPSQPGRQECGTQEGLLLGPSPSTSRTHEHTMRASTSTTASLTMAFCCRCTPSTSSGTRIASTSTLLSQRRHASSAGKKGAAPPKKKQATISSSRKSAGSSGDGAGSETKTESLRKVRPALIVSHTTVKPSLTPLLLVSTHRCCMATMQAYAKPTI